MGVESHSITTILFPIVKYQRELKRPHFVNCYGRQQERAILPSIEGARKHIVAALAVRTNQRHAVNNAI